MQKKCTKQKCSMFVAVIYLTLAMVPGSVIAGNIHQSTADHGKFRALDQDFTTGQEVTKACLSCHTEAGKQFHKTYHWTWQSEGGIQKGIGKKNVLNNF